MNFEGDLKVLPVCEYLRERHRCRKIDRLYHILNKNAKNAFNKKMRLNARQSLNSKEPQVINEPKIKHIPGAI